MGIFTTITGSNTAFGGGGGGGGVDFSAPYSGDPRQPAYHARAGSGGPGGGGGGGDGTNTNRQGRGGIGYNNGGDGGTSPSSSAGGGAGGINTGGGGGGGAGQHGSKIVGTGGAGLNSGVTGTWAGGAGGANTGGGGGGGTHQNNAGGNGGSGIVVLRYLTFAAPTTFASATSSATNTNSPITFSITFAQSVDSVAASDFTNVGTATGCSFAINAASGTTFVLTVSSCSEGTLVPQITAGSMRSVTSGANGPTSNTQTTTPIRIDRTAPTIGTVTAPANKTYIPSETPTFTVPFSESVTITGTPRLTLTVGSTTEYATFVSMPDSRTALFRYTVASDPLEFDTDGISLTTSLDLNNGSISDLATNAIVDRTFSAPTLTSVLVAQPPAAPTIDSITATSGTLTVYFTPGATRGSAITNYTYATNGTTFKTRTDGTTASPLVITTVSTGATNLVNGTGYQIRLRAVSAAGTSDSSTVVNETPTAVSVTGDSTLILTYGNSASTSSYSATGGTNTYTWSLGSVISGVTLSGTVVTASNTLAAGSYSQTVRATDGNSQVGTRSLTITVNKASTSISIALPNSSTSAALGGAVTITATVSRAGSVNFQLGGSTISGCGSVSASSTSATCSWTPGALGSVSLTATFTPTDSSNFETSTTTTLSVTVVNGVSTVTLSLAGGVTTAPKGQAINIIASIDQAGRVTFLIDGKRVPGCINRLASIGNITCSWRPAVQKAVVITANLNPTNNVYNNSSSRLAVQVTRRTGNR
jgi:hypothetical protein